MAKLPIYTKATEPAAKTSRFTPPTAPTIPEPVVFNDPVNHPSHYASGQIECIDAIAAALGRDGFIAFLQGQAMKYSWRLDKKGHAIEDARKAQWYLNKLVEVLDA